MLPDKYHSQQAEQLKLRQTSSFRFRKDAGVKGYEKKYITKGLNV